MEAVNHDNDNLNASVIICSSLMSTFLNVDLTYMNGRLHKGIWIKSKYL